MPLTSQCPKVAHSKVHWLLTMLLKMKRVVPMYIEILWVTTFILENCSIYCEKQMSFSSVVAVFHCKGFTASGDSKEHPHSHFVFFFHGIFPLAFLCWLDVLFWSDLWTECCLLEFVALFVSSLTGPLPP